MSTCQLGPWLLSAKGQVLALLKSFNTGSGDGNLVYFILLKRCLSLCRAPPAFPLPCALGGFEQGGTQRSGIWICYHLLWAQGKNGAVGREGGEEVVWHHGAGEGVWDSVCFTVSQEIFFVTPVVHVFTDYYF